MGSVLPDRSTRTVDLRAGEIKGRILSARNQVGSDKNKGQAKKGFSRP